MMELKVNGRILDVKPGTDAEIERSSPFFSITDINTEHSTPISIPYTDNNDIALENAFHYYNIREKKKIEAELFSNGISKGKCMLMLESAEINYNNIERNTLNGYVLFGISHFFQVIKDKKLSDLSLGGIRKFVFTSSDGSDGSNGYWQHFEKTWSDKTIPYVFQPVRNDDYYGEGVVNLDQNGNPTGVGGWMNQLDNNLKLLFDPKNILVPMIRYKYLLEQVFIENGFTIDFSLMGNQQWEKLILIGTKKIDWVAVDLVNGKPQPTAAPGIIINLARHVPTDKTIADFLIQTFLRYGWAPVFEGRNCKLTPVKNLKNGPRKDWTAFASPLFKSNFAQDNPIYAFDTEIDQNDKLPSEPDLTDKRIGFPVAIQGYLNPPGVSDEGMIRFCWVENQWQQAQLDETTNTYKWVVFADNIYSYKPDNASETIDTTIGAVPSYLTIHRPGRGPNGQIMYGYYPMIKQESTKPFGYRTAFYHGLVPEIADKVYNVGPLSYPLCTSVYNPADFISGDSWSNVYKHTTFGGTVLAQEYGIYDFWWKPFLDHTARGEEVEFELTLPIMDYLQHSWSDVILISNIPYFVKSITEPVPYKGTLHATLKRILQPQIVTQIAQQDNTELTIYVKMEIANVYNVRTAFETTYGDVVIKFFTDIAGTKPYKPDRTIYVYVKNTFINNSGVGASSGENLRYYPADSSESIILHNTMLEQTFIGNIMIKRTFTLDPTGAFGYTVI